MKKLSYILSFALVCFMVDSCSSFKSLYDKYESNAMIPNDVYGFSTVDSLAVTPPAQLSWRDFFLDPLLQQLID